MTRMSEQWPPVAVSAWVAVSGTLSGDDDRPGDVAVGVQWYSGRLVAHGVSDTPDN